MTVLPPGMEQSVYAAQAPEAAVGPQVQQNAGPAQIPLQENKGGKKKGCVLGAIGCGIIVLLLIAVLVPALLLPALNKSREKAQIITCTSNLKQIGLGIRMFADDNKDFFPRSIVDIKEYVGGLEAIHCPLDADCRYRLLAGVGGRNSSKIENPSEYPIVICTNHKNVDVVLYADGHCSSVPKGKYPESGDAGAESVDTELLFKEHIDELAQKMHSIMKAFYGYGGKYTPDFLKDKNEEEAKEAIREKIIGTLRVMDKTDEEIKSYMLANMDKMAFELLGRAQMSESAQRLGEILNNIPQEQRVVVFMACGSLKDAYHLITKAQNVYDDEKDFWRDYREFRTTFIYNDRYDAYVAGQFKGNISDVAATKWACNSAMREYGNGMRNFRRFSKFTIKEDDPHWRPPCLRDNLYLVLGMQRELNPKCNYVPVPEAIGKDPLVMPDSMVIFRCECHKDNVITAREIKRAR